MLPGTTAGSAISLAKRKPASEQRVEGRAFLQDTSIPTQAVVSGQVFGEVLGQS